MRIVPSTLLRRWLPAVLLSLTACAGTGTRDSDVVDTSAEIAPVEIAPTPAGLLQQAAGRNATDAAPLLLQAATLYRDTGDLAEALRVLDRIEPSVLTSPHSAAISLLRAEIAMARNLPREAVTLLQADRLPPPETLEPELQIRILAVRAEAQAATGATLASAISRIALDVQLDGMAQRENHDLIWRALAGLPQNQLQALSASTDDVIAHGWFDLALAAQSYSTDLDRQLVELQRWRSAWPTHPAALVMPPQMELIETLARERPRRIALLLPLDNSAGAIVRDAFMSAYFHLQELGGQVPAVKIYDTANLDDIRQLHMQARQEGAELIIGPLLKQHVAQLHQETDLGVPTLALNNVEGQAPASPLLYQFALSPEDEARQLAARAWQDGHRRVAILGPIDGAGSDTAVRKRDSFRAEWERLGGKVVALNGYREAYQDSISEMLLLGESAERQRRLSQLLGRTAVAELRRRQDIDFIYLVAQPAPARQIVPSLAYLYAGDIPVYASQDVYAGTARQTDDRDLNGVIFGESPWLLESAGDIGRTRQLFPVASASNLRLQAFGIDAFRLYPRLRLLASAADSSIPGTSGLLKLGSNRNITRELIWATIADGLIRLAP
jgi:outer membrane PBP1 activator LpoA protein